MLDGCFEYESWIYVHNTSRGDRDRHHFEVSDNDTIISIL